MFCFIWGREVKERERESDSPIILLYKKSVRSFLYQETILFKYTD
jgi:hypothetical protein